jgi:hypothetical protein
MYNFDPVVNLDYFIDCTVCHSGIHDSVGEAALAKDDGHKVYILLTDI